MLRRCAHALKANIKMLATNFIRSPCNLPKSVYILQVSRDEDAAHSMRGLALCKHICTCWEGVQRSPTACGSSDHLYHMPCPLYIIMLHAVHEKQLGREFGPRVAYCWQRIMWKVVLKMLVLSEVSSPVTKEALFVKMWFLNHFARELLPDPYHYGQRIGMWHLRIVREFMITLLIRSVSRLSINNNHSTYMCSTPWDVTTNRNDRD